MVSECGVLLLVYEYSVAIRLGVLNEGEVSLPLPLLLPHKLAAMGASSWLRCDCVRSFG